MKKFIALALATVIALSINAATTRTDAFAAVKISAPVNVTFAPGRAYTVNVISNNEALASTIKWTVVDGMLYISSSDIEALEQADESVQIIVTSPNGVVYETSNDMQIASESETELPQRHFRPRRSRRN